jgi:hypothetical protein
MALDLVNFEQQAADAIKAFWGNREAARQKQIKAGKNDVGERAAVTGGKNLNGFVTLLTSLVEANGLGHADIYEKNGLLVLPGYFRPTKNWDILITYKKQLIAAIELKSQVGPSFGKNFNNRTEEAIGSSHDLWTAYREGAFGAQPRPFVAWLMVVEDTTKSRCPVRIRSPHFPVFAEFKGASYLKRYDLLCQRLVKEQLYSNATLLATPRGAAKTGEFRELSDMTSLKTFVTAFAGHIAAEAARLS